MGELAGDSVYNISLEMPVVTERVRVLLYTWIAIDPCLHLQLFGCASLEKTGGKQTGHLAVAVGTPLTVTTVTALLVLSAIVAALYYRKRAMKRCNVHNESNNY